MAIENLRDENLLVLDVRSSRSNEPWTPEEDNQLRIRIAEGETVRTIATHFGRTTRAIRRRAEKMKLSWRKAKGK
jgi:hypothetical protein